MNVVELNGVTKRYKNVVAARDISLQVKAGEFLFLLGPSGCGKTTTLRIIGGLEDPTEGTVMIQGINVNGKPPEKRDTATVFQSWALFPHKSVSGNLAFGLKMRKKSKKEISEKIESFLELVGLAGLGDRYPAQLSGGQQQRVALARALVVEPAVLLLDEPLSALDLKLRQQMRFEIKRIQKELNVTTIFVTHDQTEAMVMGDRIVIMNEGRIEQVGSPSEIYYQPRSRFISDFIGETNFLKGRVLEVGSEWLQIQLEIGAEISASFMEKGQPSDEALVSIRPESIRLSKEKTQNGKNILTGTLEEIVFMGATSRCHVRIGDQIVKVDAVGGSIPEKWIDDEVYLEIDPKDCLFLST